MESYPFTLKKLNYQYDAIEPAVSAKTMKIHHQKHHKSYIDKLNETVKNSNFLKELPIDQLIS
jgi:superoxide dismutase, Fe-Mn family